MINVHVADNEGMVGMRVKMSTQNHAGSTLLIAIVYAPFFSQGYSFMFI